MSDETAPMLECEGWWEQGWTGRQYMSDLRMSISGGRVFGSGHDMVGIFTFEGTIDEGGTVVMVKVYPTHNVHYVGKYDGEGTMSGEWEIVNFDRGPWMIRIARATVDESMEIQEFVPVPQGE